MVNSDFKLGINYGFTKGQYSSNFPSGYLSGETRDSIIFSKSKEIKDIFFNFNKASTCESIIADPIQKFIEDGIDNRIYKFLIQKIGVDHLENDFIFCENNKEVQKFPIDKSHLNFPSTASKNASLNLVIMDPSGNESEPFKIEIPPCPTTKNTSTISIPYCWSS